ncbi:hypothetical chloroplast RF21, chloroplastic [Tanacetum coccineum]
MNSNGKQLNDHPNLQRCFTNLIIDYLLSLNKSIPRRSDSKLHSSQDDHPITKLLNTTNGDYRFGMEVPDAMINDAIKKKACGRGKGFMCYGDQVANVPNKLKKDVVPRKTRSLTIAAEAIVGEGLSATHNKYYSSSNTVSDATLYSLSSDESEESANEIDDADESDMDLSHDNPHGDDDDARKFNFKKAVAQRFKEYDQKLEALTNFNISEAFEKSVQAKVLTEIKKLLPTHIPNAIVNYVKPLSNTSVLEDPPNNHEGENKKKRRKDVGELFSRSSRRNKSPMVIVQDDTPAMQPLDQADILIQNIPNHNGFQRSRVSSSKLEDACKACLDAQKLLADIQEKNLSTKDKKAELENNKLGPSQIEQLKCVCDCLQALIKEHNEVISNKQKSIEELAQASKHGKDKVAEIDGKIMNGVGEMMRSQNMIIKIEKNDCMEAMGVVIVVGPGLTDWQVGDGVAYALNPMGSYAEEQILPSDRVVLVPSSIDPSFAASVFLKGMTAQFHI